MISVALVNGSQVQSNGVTHKSNKKSNDKPTIETLFNSGMKIHLDGASFSPNQLYIDLNNEERVNVRKETELEQEAMRLTNVMLSNIKDDPHKAEQIRVLKQTDPFCNFKSIIDLLKKELNADHEQ